MHQTLQEKVEEVWTRLKGNPREVADESAFLPPIDEHNLCRHYANSALSRQVERRRPPIVSVFGEQTPEP